MNKIMEEIESKEYKCAFTEVLAVLDSISQEDYNKVPEDVISTLKAFQDTTYEYKLDSNKDFTEQNISDIAKAILANFYRDYWATEEERNQIIKEENLERAEIEKEKYQKYNPNDIFKNQEVVQKPKINENLIIVEKNESIIQKIINKIKNLIKHN